MRKDINQLRAKVAAWEQFLREAQAELIVALREECIETAQFYTVAKEYHATDAPPLPDDYEAGKESDPLYSPEAVRDMRKHVATRKYVTANGKTRWYIVEEGYSEYQGA